MIKYAQLDETGKCIGISFLSGEVKSDLMIPLKDDENYLGWTYSKGKWSEPEEEEQKSAPQSKTLDDLFELIDEKIKGKTIESADDAPEEIKELIKTPRRVSATNNKALADAFSALRKLKNSNRIGLDETASFDYDEFTAIMFAAQYCNYKNSNVTMDNIGNTSFLSLYYSYGGIIANMREWMEAYGTTEPFPNFNEFVTMVKLHLSWCNRNGHSWIAGFLKGVDEKFYE